MSGAQPSNGNSPRDPGRSAMPDHGVAKWLVTPGPRVTEVTWHCARCGHTQRLNGWDDPLPRIHVAVVGHPVTLQRAEMQDLIPVNIAPPG